MIFDREPAELPVATLRPREASQRARVLVDHLRHWLAARWMWLRPRTVPVVAAAVGTLLVLISVDYMSRAHGAPLQHAHTLTIRVSSAR